MRFLIITIFFLFAISVQAQFKPQRPSQKSNPNAEIDAELLKYLESDVRLYMDYTEAQNGLNSARTMGFVTVGFIVADFVFYSAASNSNSIIDIPFYAGMFVLSSLATGVVGTIALVKHSNAKSKMRSLKTFAKYQMQQSTSLDLNISGAGLGLVYSF